MKVLLRESEQAELRRWASRRTRELVEIKAELLRHEAKRTQYGTRLRAKLFAVASFLLFDKAIRQEFAERE